MRILELSLCVAMAGAVLAGCDGKSEDAAADAAAELARSAGGEKAERGAAVDASAVHARLVHQLDSLDTRLRTVPNLTRDERSRLRRDVNEVQIARARQLGVRVTGAVDPLVDAGRLVRLPDSTAHWVLRELDYSVPYVTPDAAAMLKEMAERFQARLDSLGVARYRLDITSVLRTPEKQAELRRRNANASRTESSHEFATTVDVAYRRFAAPAEPFADVDLASHARVAVDSMFVELGRERGAELQAVLGRVILEMQREGRLMVVMERRQTVFHLTVAKRYPKGAAGNGG